MRSEGLSPGCDGAGSGQGEPLGSEDILLIDTLHPRHVCWILAVAAGVKPSAMIESIDANKWEHFVRLFERLDLCFAYMSSEKTVIGLRGNQIDSFSDQTKVKVGTRTYLCFTGDNWQRQLQGKPAHFDIRSELSVDLAPITYKGLDVEEVYVSNRTAQLMDLVRSRHKGLEAKWDAASAGKALGYPECCIDSYISLGSSGAAARHKFFRELIEEGRDQSMPIEFWAIFHVPCSASCQRSIELGRAYLEAVRGYSNALFKSVTKKLRCSHLAYSVGERFLDYEPVPEDTHTFEPSAKENAIEKSREMIGSAAEVELSNVKRPFLYVDEEYDNVKLHLTPRIIGTRWIAYSPGNGVLIQDTKTDEVFLFLNADALGEDSARFLDTAFRVYRSQ